MQDLTLTLLTPYSTSKIGARVIYPNHTPQPPGARFNFWHYRPALPGWYIYGQAWVTPDGKQVVPDPGVSVYEFTGAMFGGKRGGAGQVLQSHNPLSN